jgi:predicted branched-subunit amino acid permease
MEQSGPTADLLRRKTVSQRLDRVFVAGLRDAIPVSISFFFLFLAVGATSANAGLDVIQGVTLSLLVFAAPAQLIIADMVASQNIGAVLLTTLVINFRFTVMSTALMAFFRSVSKGALFAGLAMISASTFGVSFIRFKDKDDPLSGGEMFRYYLGVSALSFVTAVLSTLLGAVLATRANAAVLEVTKLILPLYFATLLAREWGKARPLIAAGLGFVCAAIAEPLYPNFGLVIAAVLVGLVMTLAVKLEARDV